MQRLRLLITLICSALVGTSALAYAQQNVPQPETRTDTVFVSGEVVNPGAYQIKATDGVAELIARAGGPTAFAALTKVMVQRADGFSITLDLHAAIRQGQAQPEFPLRGGDHIVVPKNQNRVLVMGAVKNPGYYVIPEKGTLSVAQALILAGGTRGDKEAKDIALLRRTTTGIQSQVLTDAKLDQELLQSNDAVYVAQAKPAVPPGPRQAPLRGYFWFLAMPDLN